MFDDQTDDGDQASGTIYVLRSKSDHPLVAENRAILHKIGVTGGSVERRVANARLDPTYLMADVEIVATYELYNINRTKLESLIHQRLWRGAPRRRDHGSLRSADRAEEWFLVPLLAVDEAVNRIKDGTITDYVYSPSTARLVERGALPPLGGLT